MMSDIQKKLRRWFQRHKWHTQQTPTNQGFWLESPVQNCAGMMHFDAKENRYYCREMFLEIELDRFLCNSVSFKIFERKHYYNGSPRGDSPLCPSDDFSEWTRQDHAPSISLPANDIVKLGELIKAAEADWMNGRKSKKHLNFMERISKSCPLHWIGVNDNYDTLKEKYGEKGKGMKLF